MEIMEITADAETTFSTDIFTKALAPQFDDEALAARLSTVEDAIGKVDEELKSTSSLLVDIPDEEVKQVTESITKLRSWKAVIEKEKFHITDEQERRKAVREAEEAKAVEEERSAENLRKLRVADVVDNTKKADPARKPEGRAKHLVVDRHRLAFSASGRREVEFLSGDKVACLNCAKKKLACTFNMPGGSKTKACDLCRTTKGRCTFPGSVSAPARKRKAHADISVSPSGDEGSKKKRVRSPGFSVVVDQPRPMRVRLDLEAIEELHKIQRKMDEYAILAMATNHELSLTRDAITKGFLNIREVLLAYNGPFGEGRSVNTAAGADREAETVHQGENDAPDRTAMETEEQEGDKDGPTSHTESVKTHDTQSA